MRDMPQARSHARVALMTDTAPYKKKLEEEKARLESELSSIGRRNPTNPADWEALPDDTGTESDESDTAENIEGYAANTSILNELEIRYNHVLAALRRIDEGTYGVCTVGGEKIAAARLGADPAAATCTVHMNG